MVGFPVASIVNQEDHCLSLFCLLEQNRHQRLINTNHLCLIVPEAAGARSGGQASRLQTATVPSVHPWPKGTGISLGSVLSGPDRNPIAEVVSPGHLPKAPSPNTITVEVRIAMLEFCMSIRGRGVAQASGHNVEGQSSHKEPPPPPEGRTALQSSCSHLATDGKVSLMSEGSGQECGEFQGWGLTKREEVTQQA